MEHEVEFRKLVSRGSDYDELLREGHVVRRVDDAVAWREAIRAQARADRIKVRTGLSSSDAGVAWAYLKHLDDKELTDQEVGSASQHVTAVQEAFERASLRGHRVRRVIRAEGQRAAAVCPDCGARLYVDWSGRPVFMEGEVFEIDCPAG